LGFQLLAPVGFFESKGHERNGGTHCFVALHDDPVKENKLAVVAFRGRDKDDPRDVIDDVKAALVPWSGRGRPLLKFRTNSYPSFRRSIAEYSLPGIAWEPRWPRCWQAQKLPARSIPSGRRRWGIRILSLHRPA
jgi:hypothetical protein